MEETTEKIKKLISALQGAPYPASINNELYTIWYEHAQMAAQEGLELVDHLRQRKFADTKK